MGGGGRNKRMVQLRWWPPGRILLPFNERWEPVFSERSSKQLVSHPQLSFVPHFMKSLCPQPTPAPKYRASRHAADYSTQLLAGCHLCSYKAANCHCPPFVEFCLLKGDCKLVRSACTWSSLDRYFVISIHFKINYTTPIITLTDQPFTPFCIQKPTSTFCTRIAAKMLFALSTNETMGLKSCCRLWVSFSSLRKNSLKTVSCVHCTAFSIGQKSS